MILRIDQKSKVPIFRQIVEQVRRLIGNQSLRAGERLPSTRRLAETLGIHRSTVSTAYQELWSLGYIDMRPGSSPRVRSRIGSISRKNRPDQGDLNWGTVSSQAAKEIFHVFQNFHPESGIHDEPASINFSSLEVDPRLFPSERFRTSMNRALKYHAGKLYSYGDRAGFPPLREAIAQRLQTHGIDIGGDEIMITNGSMQGLDLVLRMLAQPGRSVAVESPTYAQIIPLLRFHGFHIHPIPMTGSGMDLEHLDTILSQNKPALVYTMPNFQNPTGLSTSQSHRERLLCLCERYRVPILEDGFEEEMKYFGRVVLPLKSMDRRRIVIYCGSFSKVLFPGIRMGWIAADRECILRLTAIRRFSELSPSMMLQAGLYEFLRFGYFNLHIRKMHRIFRRRMQIALRELRCHVSRKWADWIEPLGGYLIWLKVKSGLRPDSDWNDYFIRHMVRAAPGGYFFPGETEELHLRLSISSLDESEIMEGIGRLSRLLGSLADEKQSSNL